MANINDIVQQIRQAVYGKDVRESIARGIESINEEVESTTSRQNSLEATFQQLIINAGNSNAEIVDARTDEKGRTYFTLGDRLDSIPNSLIESPGVKFIAHRGLSYLAPENTLPAYELAGMLGFWGAETDTTVTADGYWVIMHDDTVDRMTDGTGYVKNFTLNQIKQLNIDSGNKISNYTGTKVPTLEEYIQVCKKWNMIPVIEIKEMSYTSDNYNSFVNIIKKYDLEEKCIVISFSTTVINEIRNRSKLITLGPILDINEQNINYVKSLGRAFIDCYYTQATLENVQYCHNNGVKVGVWTVNDYIILQNMINNNIDFITTDILIM